MTSVSRVGPDKELDLTIIEDIELLSEVWSSKETRNSTIRNSANILRRLLIYNDLQKSASSRKYNIVISAPDVKPLVKAGKSGLIEFFQSGGANLFGLHVAGAVIESRPSHKLDQLMKEYHPDHRVDLNLTSFLRQDVFFFRGKFVSRADIIKYVANKAGSSHFDRKERDETIEKIRSTLNIKLNDGKPAIGFDTDQLSETLINFDPDPRAVDPLLIELIATAGFLTESDSIKQYCQLLKREYGF